MSTCEAVAWAEVRRVYIPKANGGERPLGIPNIIDRVVQTAAKLVLEPIYEADFESDSYGFRPKRSAHDALKAVGESIADGMYWVIDADIERYFDSIPHDRLMKVVVKTPRGRVDESGRTAGCGKSARPVG